VTAGPVVVTGASGFIGRALCARFAASDRPYLGLVRAHEPGLGPRPHRAAVGDLATAAADNLEQLLEGATAIVHLAGRAHVLRETAADPDAAFHAANVVATERIARAALRAGVRRFVFASTIKVHGEATTPGRRFGAADPYAPADAYARSKVAAEESLLRACAETWMAPIILRLPLVFGRGVKGNFLTLLEAVARGAILPFGAVANRRDMLYLDNLVSVIERVIDHPTALSGAWLVADGTPISTPRLVRALAAPLDVQPRLWPVPVGLLALLARATGRDAQFNRVAASLEVDASPLWERIGPPLDTTGAGLDATVRWWRTHHAI
jgi:nucleoside-diphosphate-sugar epimerase